MRCKRRHAAAQPPAISDGQVKRTNNRAFNNSRTERGETRKQSRTKSREPSERRGREETEPVEPASEATVDEETDGTSHSLFLTLFPVILALRPGVTLTMQIPEETDLPVFLFFK